MNVNAPMASDVIERSISPTVTTQLLALINNADDLQQALVFYDAHITQPTLGDVFHTLLEQKDIKGKEVISRSGLNRSFFYHIIGGTRDPGRNTVLRIGLALEATIDEMNMLLRTAELAKLDVTHRRDMIIMYGLVRHSSVAGVNQMLLEAGEEKL